jgi:hypothetical protein
VGRIRVNRVRTRRDPARRDPEGAGVTGTAATALARLFRVVSRLRGRRSLHPHGVGYRGRLEVAGDGRRWPGVPLLERPATYPALVRCSRSSGLPEPLPDVLGIAVKLPGAYDDGADQDLLFSSAPDRAVLRGVLFPARSFLRGVFSTLLPYRVGRRRLVLWLRPARKQPGGGGRAFAQLRRAVADTAGFELWAGGGLRRPRMVGWLSLTVPLPDGEAERLRFNPWTTGPGLRPSGWVNRLRRPSYAASQEGWNGDEHR